MAAKLEGPGRRPARTRRKRWCGCAAASRYDEASGRTGSAKDAQRRMQRGERGCKHVVGAAAVGEGRRLAIAAGRCVRRADIRSPAARDEPSPFVRTGWNGGSAVNGGPTTAPRESRSAASRHDPANSGRANGGMHRSALLFVGNPAYAERQEARNGPFRAVSGGRTSTGPLHNRP
jgi:hypothetical protein